jgi:hypothetical protein
MPISEKDLFGDVTKRQLVEITPPGSKLPVLLRYPPFAEWHELAVAHHRCKRDSVEPAASLIVKTLAYTIADADGNRRLSDKEAESLLNCNPVTVMWIYAKAWETVLRNDDQAVAELEGNSAASRG